MHRGICIVGAGTDQPQQAVSRIPFWMTEEKTDGSDISTVSATEDIP